MSRRAAQPGVESTVVRPALTPPCAFLLSFLLLAFAPALRADDHPNTGRGFQADQAFQVGDIDNVNLFNGNLVLTIPIGGSYPAGGGLSYGLTLVYNSNLWDFQEREDLVTMVTYQQGLPQRTSNAGLGWLLTLGRILSPFTPGNDSERYLYQGSDGAEHAFYATLHVGDADEPGDSLTFQSVSYTRDGSYLRMKALAGGLREIEFPGGQIHRFDGLGRLTQIRDRFNNALTVTYGSLLWTLTDSQGRTHRVFFQNATQDNQTIEVVDRVELAAFGGATATYVFSYASATIARGCPHNDPILSPNVQVPLLTGVTPPDGSAYQMPVSDYITELSSSSPVCRSSGAIRGLTLPTLGKLEWTYQDYVFPAVGKPFRQWSPGVATRRTENASGGILGTWSYATSLAGTSGNQELRNTVTDPLLHRTERWFLALPGSHEYSLPFTHLTGDGAGRFLSTRTYNAAGSLLRTSYVRYESDQRVVIAEDQQERMAVNRREESSRTVYHDDGNRIADVDRSDFDGMGHYRTEATGGNFGAGDLRSATMAYNPARGTYKIDPATNQPAPGHNFSQWPSASPWVLGTFESRRVDEGGTEFSKYCFDANTGFLLRRRSLKNSGTTEHANDVLEAYTPDAAGNLQTEQSFGGDKQSLTANSTTCTMVLPAPAYRIDHAYQFGVRATSQYSGANFLALDLTIDGPSGLPVQSRDAAGIATDYEYDLLGRPTWVKPAVGHDGWTEYVYSPAFSSASLANVLVRRRNNGSKTAAVQAQSQVFFDAFGRVWQEKQLLPSNLWNVRETLFDAAGHKASVSETVTGTPAKKTQFLSYDPFGRAATLRPPDGSLHDVTFNYFGARVVERTVKIATTTSGAESAATTTETYDRQGRLLKVSEPSGAAGTLVTTTYSYDVGNRLRQVQTQDGAAIQNRFFTYDNRGFLVSETHPEKGASGNGNVTFSIYDARGHAGRKLDGPSDLTFVYDSAERLTLVRETLGAQRTLKSFTYGGANGIYTDPITGAACFDYRKGKVTQQSRFNYVIVNGGALTVELREGMTYCGRDGRLSRRSLENWVNGGAFEAFFLPNVTYDALGNVTSLDYPRCTHTACTAPAPRTVTSSYNQGLLSAVGIPSSAGYYAGSIAYHPNLMVNQVVHGNTLTDTYANDPNAMRRPASIAVTTSTGTTRWATGAYAYDGAGNVKAIGTHTFAYDTVSRLKTGNLYLEPTSSTTLRTQTYTYDAFGNLQAIGGNSALNTPTSSSTNRLTSGGYDAAGNLTSWSFNTYQYDPFNLMWNYRTLSDEWIYLYTADDERAWTYKTNNSSLWTLRGPDGKVLREYANNGTWSVASDYVYREGSLLAAETPQGLRHFSLDHLGTPRLVTATGGGGGDFYTLTPCRVLDTRDQSAPISAFETRTVPMVGACGIPAGASAVSVNLTVVGPSAQGELTAFPANEPRPMASAISYRAGLVRANNGILKLGNGFLAFFANQPSGSVHLIIDVNGYFMEEAGSVVAYHVYYPFGEEATAFNQDTIRAKFTGHERDLGNPGGAGDDLDYMHARHCSPLTGRFLSTDIASGKPRRPQSWNRYVYVWNSPLGFIDPNGLEPIDPAIAQFLGSYFGQDVSHVKVFGGPLARTLAFISNRALAITIGQRIFFSGAAWKTYKAKSLEGIATTGHEVRHTIDFKKLGLLRFFVTYLRQWSQVGFQYFKIPLEIAAYQDEARIVKLLENTPGLLESIQAGGSVSVGQAPSASGWTIITSISEGPIGGLSALFDFGGELYIDGINLTGVFSASPPR